MVYDIVLPTLLEHIHPQKRLQRGCDLESNKSLSHYHYNHALLSGWWFQPLWKILISWDYCSQYVEKTKRFQTTSQLYCLWTYVLTYCNQRLLYQVTQLLLQCGPLVINWFINPVNTTVDGQNIQTLQHAICWTPAPPNLNVSSRALAKVMLGVWFFSSIGANAFQVTITLNFGGEGVVQDRRGLNISSIYGTNSGVRHAAHPSWYCLALWCFHIFWSPNSVVETSMCMLLILFQTAQNIGFSQVNASCLSPVPFFSIP